MLLQIIVLVFVMVIVIVAAIVAAVMATAVGGHRSKKLRQGFGPEYDRMIKKYGDVRLAEEVLAKRQRRVAKFVLRSLIPIDQTAYTMEWIAVQRRFVDDPSAAMECADRLISDVLTDCGYPRADFEQRAADVSVSYPTVVQNYRTAHEIAQRHRAGHGTTEDLRQAMIHYRSLLDHLLDSGESEVEVKSIERSTKVSRERTSGAMHLAPKSSSQECLAPLHAIR